VHKGDDDDDDDDGDNNNNNNNNNITLRGSKASFMTRESPTTSHQING